MSEGVSLLLYLVVFVVAITMLLAQARLFSIDRTLKSILNELRAAQGTVPAKPDATTSPAGETATAGEGAAVALSPEAQRLMERSENAGLIVLVLLVVAVVIILVLKLGRG